MKTSKALSPRQAVELYAKLNGGEAHTRQLIAMALREGRLQARVRFKWISSESSILVAWKTKPSNDSALKPLSQRIDRSLWWKSVRWADDILDWDFRRNRMLVTVGTEPLERVLLSGVSFKSSDLTKLLAPGSLSLESGTIAKASNRDMWRPFWHELIVLAAGSKDSILESGLARYKSGDAFAQDIYSRLSSDKDDTDANISDETLSHTLSSRQQFNLGYEAIHKEIKLLRKHFDLKTWGRK